MRSAFSSSNSSKLIVLSSSCLWIRAIFVSSSSALSSPPSLIDDGLRLFLVADRGLAGLALLALERLLGLLGPIAAGASRSLFVAHPCAPPSRWRLAGRCETDRATVMAPGGGQAVSIAPGAQPPTTSAVHRTGSGPSRRDHPLDQGRGVSGPATPR